MSLLVQSEISGNEVKTTYMYVCIVCRYKEVVEKVHVRRNGDKFLVSVYKGQYA